MAVTSLIPADKPKAPIIEPKKTKDLSPSSDSDKDKKKIEKTDDKISKYILAGKIFFIISLLSIATLFFFGDYIIAAKIITEKFFFYTSIISSILGAVCFIKAENVMSKTQSPSEIEEKVETKTLKNSFTGLNNKGCNCFMNAFMQMAMRVKNLRNYLVSDDNKLKDFKDFILQYEKDLKDKKELSKADSQKLREAIHSIHPEISKNVSTQEDAYEIFTIIKNLMDENKTAFFTNMKSTSYYRKDNMDIPLDEINEINCGQIELPIESKKSFQESFDNFFNEKVDGATYMVIEDQVDYRYKSNHSLWDSLTFRTSEPFIKKVEKHYPMIKTTREYEKAPDDMFVNLKRFSFDKKKNRAIKNNDVYEVDENIFLKHKNNQKYELDAFVRHLGRTPGSGHYVAYVKIDNKWYVFNDERVSLVSDDELKEAKSHAYFYHFAKVS
jgi:ubiquitin C-terminal hydrolase